MEMCWWFMKNAAITTWEAGTYLCLPDTEEDPAECIKVKDRQIWVLEARVLELEEQLRNERAQHNAVTVEDFDLMPATIGTA